MTRQRFLGIVRGGVFRRLTPIRDPAGGCRLSNASGDGDPQAGEIALAEYEGAAILVEGRAQELWINDAEVVEKGGPIVTELVQYVLGHPAPPVDPKPIEAP